jgi:GntR family transcriptional regulator
MLIDWLKIMPTKKIIKDSKHATLLEALAELSVTLKPHSQLPSERALSEEYGVSRMTLRRAIDVLQARGYIYSVPSKGLFVAEPRMVRTSDVTSLSEVLRHRGNNPKTKLHLADRIHASDEVAKALGLRKGDWVYRVEQSFFDADIAMATETAYIPAELAPGLLEQDLATSLSSILANHYEKPILRVQYRVRSVIPEEKFRERLDLAVGAPTFEFFAVGIISKERSAFLVVSYKRGDKYDLSYQLEV